MEDVEYSCELSDIRRFLERNVEDFPFNKCQVASRFLNLALGLEEVSGWHRNLEHHSWNYDSERELYVDLTMDQFYLPHKGEMLKINILPVNNNFLFRDNEETFYQKNMKEFYSVKMDNLLEIYKYSKITS